MNNSLTHLIDHRLMEAISGTTMLTKTESTLATSADKSLISSDEVVLRQIQSGRMDLIDVLVNRYSDFLYRIILRLVQLPGTAEDILQETWIKIIRKIHQYDSTRPFSSWASRVAVNSCRDYWRKEKRRRFWKHSVENGSPHIVELEKTFTAETCDKMENQIMITKALMRISRKLREVVVLKFYCGMTHDEIARVLEIPSGTVKSRLHFALSKLRNFIAVEGAGT